MVERHPVSVRNFPRGADLPLARGRHFLPKSSRGGDPHVRECLENAAGSNLGETEGKRYSLLLIRSPRDALFL